MQSILGGGDSANESKKSKPDTIPEMIAKADPKYKETKPSSIRKKKDLSSLFEKENENSSEEDSGVENENESEEGNDVRSKNKSLSDKAQKAKEKREKREKDEKERQVLLKNINREMEEDKKTDGIRMPDESMRHKLRSGSAISGAPDSRILLSSISEIVNKINPLLSMALVVTLVVTLPLAIVYGGPVLIAAAAVSGGALGAYLAAPYINNYALPSLKKLFNAISEFKELRFPSKKKTKQKEVENGVETKDSVNQSNEKTNSISSENIKTNENKLTNEKQEDLKAEISEIPKDGFAAKELARRNNKDLSQQIETDKPNLSSQESKSESEKEDNSYWQNIVRNAEAQRGHDLNH